MWAGAVGTFVSLFGCGLIAFNQMTPGRAMLIVAWLILVPLFLYVLVLRSRASAEYKRRKQRREAQARRELESLASVDAMLAEGASGEGARKPD
jgi:hypothetical protein